MYDGNGNVGQMIDADDGELEAFYEYDPYGNLINSAGTYAAVNPFRFSTRYFDNETGLGSWLYRYYIPELGIWLTRDPLNEYGHVLLRKVSSGFPGQYFDDETGLHYNWWRYYNPKRGGAIVADPIGLYRVTNLYSYVGVNPGNAVDPLGLESWSFGKLKQAYQSRDAMLKGKKFPKWALDAIMSSNGGSCATRMSNAFNRAEYDLLKTTEIRKVSDGLGNYYILGAHEFAQAVSMASKAYRVKNIECLYGKNGIIYFENYHIDLFDGQQMVGNGDITDDYKSKVIYFKELDN